MPQCPGVPIMIPGHKRRVQITLPKALLDAVTAEARQQRKHRSTLVARAIAQYLAAMEEKRSGNR